jgi:predicted transcriptional regulator
MLLSKADVIEAISDKHSLDLLKMVALANFNTKIFRKESKISSKQYYFRMSRLTRVGVIKRKNGKYSLTSFGKIVYDAETMIEDAVRNYEKLKIIETLEDFSDADSLVKEEIEKLINRLRQLPNEREKQ